MDISSSQARGVAPVHTVKAGPVPPPEAAYKASGQSTSQVSSSAKELAGLAKMAREAPDVRQEKVDQLKSQVDSGQYQVDLEKLADHLSQVL